MCFNWKVLAGLAAVGLGVYVAAPELVASALPLLLLAACPLSMLLMGKSMMGGQCATPGQEQARQPGQQAPASAGAASAGVPTAGVPSANAASAEVALGREDQLAQLRARLASVQAEQAALAAKDEALAAADEAGAPGAARDGTVRVVLARTIASASVTTTRDEPAPADVAGRPRTES